MYKNLRFDNSVQVRYYQSGVHTIVSVTNQYNKDRTIKRVKDYDVDNVSTKVVRIILSYTDYINRTVWHREDKVE